MRKQGWAYWQAGLQEGSNALKALDAYAAKLGMTRAEANRVLLVQWADGQIGTPPQTTVVQATHKNKNGSSAAAAIDLDM